MSGLFAKVFVLMLMRGALADEECLTSSDSTSFIQAGKRLTATPNQRSPAADQATADALGEEVAGMAAEKDIEIQGIREEMRSMRHEIARLHAVIQQHLPPTTPTGYKTTPKLHGSRLFQGNSKQPQEPVKEVDMQKSRDADVGSVFVSNEGGAGTVGMVAQRPQQQPSSNALDAHDPPENMRNGTGALLEQSRGWSCCYANGQLGGSVVALDGTVDDLFDDSTRTTSLWTWYNGDCDTLIGNLYGSWTSRTADACESWDCPYSGNSCEYPRARWHVGSMKLHDSERVAYYLVTAVELTAFPSVTPFMYGANAIPIGR